MYVLRNQVGSLKRFLNCRRLNWDTVSQPVNDLFGPEIQPKLPNFDLFGLKSLQKVLIHIQLRICLTEMIVPAMNTFSHTNEEICLFVE